MTASEWISCTDPRPMLDSLRGRASDRQLRLFACACCRSIQGFIPPGACRDAIEVALGYADGQATAEELAVARRAAIAKAGGAGHHAAAAWAACATTEPSAARAAVVSAAEAVDLFRGAHPEAVEEESAAQAGYLRDIIGDPFGADRWGYSRRWAGHPAIQEIAQQLYGEPSNDDMDALGEELARRGCSVPAVVLSHCRSSGPHVCGCWVIDLILAHEVESTPAGPPVPDLPPDLVAVRTALAQHLGPQRFARFLRRALAGPRPPREWYEFVQGHPEYAVPADHLSRIWRQCCVHGCDVVERTVGDVGEPPGLARDPTFLRARGTRFPYSFPSGDAEAEPCRKIWWCLECQRARVEWECASADPSTTSSDAAGECH